MLRRSPRSATALDQTKQELARQESELRDQMEKLERMIADAPRVAEEVERRQREELLMRASQGGSRLDVSMALQDKRYSESGPGRRRGSLRKERREGRIVFLVLIIALLAAAIWLLNRLHF
jgi:septal ring factor EnvC (AmiA/AmiB activator)